MITQSGDGYKNAHVVVITNQKGGVGKSTTAEALADGLIVQGYKTLLVDLDPQGSITLTAGADPHRITTYEVMIRSANAQEATRQDAHDDTQEVRTRADIIPASRQLVKLDVELTATGKEYRLKEQLAPILPLYDYIIIDTPPALGVLTVNALTAADCLIIPAQADVYSLQGVGQLVETINTIRAYTNPGLALAGILLTRHTPRSILSRDMAEAATDTAAQIGTFVYDTVIREAIAIKEAQANQQSIYDYAPKSNAATDYMAFTTEFIERGIHHA
jgi:chromosome partitioning protein